MSTVSIFGCGCRDFWKRQQQREDYTEIYGGEHLLVSVQQDSGKEIAGLAATVPVFVCSLQ